MTWRVGIDSWIFDDGNYNPFGVGERRSFALEYYSRKGLAVSKGQAAPSAERLTGRMYRIAGTVVRGQSFVRQRDWCVVDFGVRAYCENRLDARLGDVVSGEIYLGVDHFAYFESLSREPGATPLIYDWQILGIEEETTPWIDFGGVLRRDERRLSWREVTTTNLPSAPNGRSFVLHCDLIGGPSLKDLMPRG